MATPQLNLTCGLSTNSLLRTATISLADKGHCHSRLKVTVLCLGGRGKIMVNGSKLENGATKKRKDEILNRYGGQRAFLLVFLSPGDSLCRFRYYVKNEGADLFNLLVVYVS